MYTFKFQISELISKMKSIEVKLQNRNIALQVNVKDLNKSVTVISKELIQDLSFDNSKK